eukprot:3500742-Rhodomonas_salina.1
MQAAAAAGGNGRRGPSHVQQREGQNAGEDSEMGETHDMLAEDIAKLALVREYHRLAMEGKLKFDFTTHLSAEFVGSLVPGLRTALMEDGADYFQSFYKLAKRKDHARTHTEDSYKMFLHEQFKEELCITKEIAGVPSEVLRSLLANKKTEGVL